MGNSIKTALPEGFPQDPDHPSPCAAGSNHNQGTLHLVHPLDLQGVKLGGSALRAKTIYALPIRGISKHWELTIARYVYMLCES